MTQQTFDFDRVTFDPVEGERRKEQGLAQAALSREEILQAARLSAVRIARQRGSVTSDDVFADLLAQGLDAAALGPAAGSVFRGKEWEFTGELKKSQRVSNHASDLRVWRLRQEQASRMEVQAARPPLEWRRQA